MMTPKERLVTVSQSATHEEIKKDGGQQLPENRRMLEHLQPILFERNRDPPGQNFNFNPLKQN